jgi:hypothetical protein
LLTHYKTTLKRNKTILKRYKTATKHHKTAIIAASGLPRNIMTGMPTAIRATTFA